MVQTVKDVGGCGAAVGKDNHFPNNLELSETNNLADI